MRNDSMIAALKAEFVPALKARGFKDSFPHFRRIEPDKIDLHTVQFDKWGGGFVIEIAKCGPEGKEHHSESPYLLSRFRRLPRLARLP
jgi:uncharacterized protein DUF4304